MVRVPLQPRLTCSQKRSRPTPNGETTPMPVMTTLGSPEWRMTATYTIWSSMTRFERLFVWVGGALFVASLAVCAYQYLFVWGSPDEVHIDAVAINALLFGLFAMHHSVFARKQVKARVARLVPERLLRSVYVWTASALLLLVCALWRPVGGEIYHVTGWRAVAPALVQLGGVWLIAASVRAIDPLELAGIRPQA